MVSNTAKLDPKLRKFVDLLIPYYNKSTFPLAFDKTCSRLTKPQQFSIKGELARLFKPFQRSIDMSTFSEYDVSEFNWGDKRFYLDPVGKRMFVLEVEKFGNQYTEGVYEAITDPAQYQEYEKQYKYEQAIKEYEVPMTVLGRTTRRLEERIYLSKPVIVSAPDLEPTELFTSNISRSGCQLKVEPFGLIKLGQTIQVNFHSLTRDYTFDCEPTFEYKVMFTSNKPEPDGSQKIGIALKSDSFDWASFLDGYITENRARFKVDIANAKDLAESRLIEDHLLKQTHWLPIFISVKDNQATAVRHCLTNEFTKQELTFFEDERKAQRLHSIIYANWPQLPLAQNETLLAIKFIRQDKVVFLSATLSELQQKDLLMPFLAFAKKHGTLAVFSVKAFAIAPEDIHTIKYNWYSSEEDANTALEPINNLTHCVMLQRLTEHEKLLVPPAKYQLTAENTQKLTSLMAPRLKVANISILSVEPQCARQEIRYFYQTRLALTHQKYSDTMACTSMDMSTCGLKVRASTMSLPLVQGDVVQVTASDFIKFGEANALNKTLYRVVGINLESMDLHLELVDPQQEKVVGFMQKLFESNAERLKVNDKYDKFVLLQRALRTLFINFYPSIGYGIFKNRQGFYFDRLLVADYKTQELKTLTKLQSPVNKNRISVFQIIHDDKRKPPLIRSIDLFSRNGKAIQDELIFQIQPNQVDIPKQSRAGANVRNIQHFIRQTLNKAQLSSLWLNILPVGESNLAQIDQQLNYIRQFNPHKAEEIEKFSDSLAGLVEVVDTSHFWHQVGELEFEYNN
ncbi:hypothetical protein C2869_11275 [Saccharobesus litoralis]|uniref:PilZ domain-containing protein n=1 Tax=Saccharobesus litoralis TaxID=2172099 RepID=A0A2S0VS36_9ALTE|nr:PilZ domain-containing protein [Saccharobesus litoralis]AWB66982.1 hypothetical protein C2869_11275 [Saccharobesus litoralis]